MAKRFEGKSVGRWRFYASGTGQRLLRVLYVVREGMSLITLLLEQLPFALYHLALALAVEATE